MLHVHTMPSFGDSCELSDGVVLRLLPRSRQGKLIIAANYKYVDVRSTMLKFLVVVKQYVWSAGPESILAKNHS